MRNVKPIEELFDELIELSSNDQQQKFLTEVCGNNAKLRDRLRDLLRSHKEAGSFLMDETKDALPDPTSPASGQTIGPYKLRELIGEGGMGSVYVAEQARPVKRKVALKVIKPGMDTKEVVARFEAERQALAMMDHPSIAKVFDAGMTETGHPYFAMELINGVPITNYCDDNKLGIRQRLELFVQVCKAVQHAHQKGVIHRDIKPTNVLVTLHDGEPVPVIIDFGVAKATNQSLTEQTIYTRLNQVVGTTLYMSPEQAELSRYGVDTRTDVYSLGVLLYELLTGTTPFDRERLNTAAFDEVRRIIREEEPPKPSTRISSLGDPATNVSAQRNTEPAKLTSTIRGDLDWIVMTALEKDRNRRYESATSFADDVENHLEDRAVEARPPSSIYRIRKVWKRNRVVLSTFSMVVVGLAIGFVAAFLAYVDKSKLSAQLQQTLSQLQEDRTDKILELTLTGDTERAEKLLAEYEDSFHGSTNDRQNQLIRAVIGVFGSDSDRVSAKAELRKLAEGGDLATKSLLVASHFHTSAEWEYWKSVGELNDYRPNTFPEFLFRGFAFSFGVPHLAVKDLEVAKRLEPANPLARVLLSRAFHYKSQRAIDRDDAIRFSERAVHEVRVATEIMRANNPLLAESRIEAYAKLIDLYFRHGTVQQKDSIDEHVKSLVDEIHRSLESPYDYRVHYSQMLASNVLRRHDLDLVNDAERQIWTLPDSEFISDEIGVRTILHHYRKNNLEEASRVTNKYRHRLIAFHLNGFLPQAEFDFRRGISIREQNQKYRMIAMDENRVDKRLNGFNDSLMLLLLGERGASRERASDIAGFFHELNTDLEGVQDFAPLAEYMAGKGNHTPDTLLSGALDHHGLIHIAFWLGVENLSRGERAEAKRYFQLAFDTECYDFFVHEWAEVFLLKIDDPNWLPWLTHSHSRVSPQNEKKRTE